MAILRRWHITDRNGVEHEITSKEVLLEILAQMTPEERERWEAQYRFAPIENDITDFHDYTGTLRDLG
jgi:hypothetical protein